MRKKLLLTLFFGGLLCFSLSNRQSVSATEVEDTVASSSVVEYHILSVQDYVSAQNRILTLPKENQDDAFKALADATPRLILTQVIGSAFSALETTQSQILPDDTQEITATNGVEVQVTSSDHATDETGRVIPEERSGFFAKKNGVTKAFGARRYDAYVKLPGIIAFDFYTHYRVGTTGLTLTSANFYIVTDYVGCFSEGVEYKEAEDKRAEKVGYDINGVCMLKSSISINLGVSAVVASASTSVGYSTTFYLVSYVKMTSKHSSSVTVDEGMNILSHSLLNTF
ncbi:hypothetical protein [Lacticaseibacillus suihuaensis]